MMTLLPLAAFADTGAKADGINVKVTTEITDSDVSNTKEEEAGRAQVGEKATLKVQILDSNGNNIALDASTKSRNSIQVEVYKIKSPEGATVDWNLPAKSDYRKSLTRDGEFAFDATSDVAGYVEFQVVITQKIYEDGIYQEGSDISLSLPLIAEFTDPEIETTQNQVKLLINAHQYIVNGVTQISDVAPFIKNNRTFVPVRMLANALGDANNEEMWDPETKVIKLIHKDITATAVIGLKTIVVEKGGVSTTVTSDVAPFIKDGRTVLPFRVLAEIFGAEVEAQFAEDGTTTSVTYITKK